MAGVVGVDGVERLRWRRREAQAGERIRNCSGKERGKTGDQSRVLETIVIKSEQKSSGGPSLPDAGP